MPGDTIRKANGQRDGRGRGLGDDGESVDALLLIHEVRRSERKAIAYTSYLKPKSYMHNMKDHS